MSFASFFEFFTVLGISTLYVTHNVSFTQLHPWGKEGRMESIASYPTLPRFFGSFENSLFLIAKNSGVGIIPYIAYKSIKMRANTLAT